MSYIPLVAFFLATAWIVWRGYSARRDYLKHRLEEFEARSAEQARSERSVQSLTPAGRQGDVPELAQALGGGQKKGSPNAIGFGASS